MSWLSLHIVAEGETERRFAESCLSPHLFAHEINAKVTVIITNRRLGKRGGVLSYKQVKDDIERRLKEDRRQDARFTTMLDFYALPNGFPGWTEAHRQRTALERVSALEAAFANDIGDRRFIACLQLHEFEALLYTDPSQIRTRIAGSGNGIEALQNEVKSLAPEEINEGQTTAPSKRLIRHVPLYEKSKPRVGAPAAAAIGHPRLRSSCAHFNAWICLGEPKRWPGSAPGRDRAEVARGALAR